MNAYLFCLMLNSAAIFGMCLMGWLVWQGASAWLVLVMLMLAISLILPGRDVFTCPKCGHVGEVKVFKSGLDVTVGVQ